jgi:phosphoribosyl 1,2-cyclic phosphodiesterase
MRFACLGSGSRGNALVVEQDRTRLMLDCGYPVRETERRLARLGLAPGDLAGILITHEHSDHIAGAYKFARKYRLPLWLTRGTLKGFPGDASDLPQINLVDSHSPFSVGALQLLPFPVPHDAREALISCSPTARIASACLRYRNLDQPYRGHAVRLRALVSSATTTSTCY